MKSLYYSPSGEGWRYLVEDEPEHARKVMWVIGNGNVHSQDYLVTYLASPSVYVSHSNTLELIFFSDNRKDIENFVRHCESK